MSANGKLMTGIPSVSSAAMIYVGAVVLEEASPPMIVINCTHIVLIHLLDVSVCSLYMHAPRGFQFYGTMYLIAVLTLGVLHVFLQVIELPLLNPELFQRVGITPPKGCLLYGPPGTGKTLLARAVSKQLDANFLKVVSSAIVDKYIGESARLIREMFGELLYNMGIT